MAEAHILVADTDAVAQIRLVGRPTFACSQSLREYGMQVVERQVPVILIDLSGCEGMDSTIMGVLAMIGLRAKKYGLRAEVVNADERHKKLLFGLGLRTLFAFTHTAERETDWVSMCHTELDPATGPMATERTVLEAHETLMNIDPQNVPKFKDVVDYLRQDIRRLEGQS